MEPEGSLPRSQELSTCTDLDPDQFFLRLMKNNAMKIGED
jgi:hypothetical protein